MTLINANCLKRGMKKHNLFIHTPSPSNCPYSNGVKK